MTAKKTPARAAANNNMVQMEEVDVEAVHERLERMVDHTAARARDLKEALVLLNVSLYVREKAPHAGSDALSTAIEFINADVTFCAGLYNDAVRMLDAASQAVEALDPQADAV